MLAPSTFLLLLLTFGGLFLLCKELHFFFIFILFLLLSYFSTLRIYTTKSDLKATISIFGYILYSKIFVLDKIENIEVLQNYKAAKRFVGWGLRTGPMTMGIIDKNTIGLIFPSYECTLTFYYENKEFFMTISDQNKLLSFFKSRKIRFGQSSRQSYLP